MSKLPASSLFWLFQEAETTGLPLEKAGGRRNFRCKDAVESDRKASARTGNFASSNFP